MPDINTKPFYDSVYESGSQSGYESDSERAEALAARLDRWKHLAPASALVLEIGCGLGHLRRWHPNWCGIEYSSSAVQRARAAGANVIEGDARQLPVPDGSIDFLFSFAALEHVPQVERAFDEIHRVLAPGGIAFLAPAWNCRPWTVKKLEMRPYSELRLREKAEKALIPLRNNFLFRALCNAPTRLSREIRLGSPLALEYRALSPDFSLNSRYPHISDDDAFVSMDAHAALAWFVSRAYASLSHPTLRRRLMVRGEEIVVRKPQGARSDAT